MGESLETHVKGSFVSHLQNVYVRMYNFMLSQHFLSILFNLQVLTARKQIDRCQSITTKYSHYGNVEHFIGYRTAKCLAAILDFF